MAMIGVIIGFRWIMYDLVPYFNVVFDWNIWIPQDNGLSEAWWITIRIGLGGYIGGRTAEKISKIIKS